MAKRRRKRRVRCKTVSVKGRRRKMCWGPRGKLVSNKAARRGRKKSRRGRRRRRR